MTCSVDGCVLSAGSKGLCMDHYAAWLAEQIEERFSKNAKDAQRVQRFEQAVTTCAIEVCNRVKKVRGMCSGHYERWRKGTDLNSPLTEYAERT